MAVWTEEPDGSGTPLPELTTGVGGTVPDTIGQDDRDDASADQGTPGAVQEPPTPATAPVVESPDTDGTEAAPGGGDWELIRDLATAIRTLLPAGPDATKYTYTRMLPANTMRQFAIACPAASGPLQLVGRDPGRRQLWIRAITADVLIVQKDDPTGAQGFLLSSAATAAFGPIDYAGEVWVLGAGATSAVQCMFTRNVEIGLPTQDRPQ